MWQGSISGFQLDICGVISTLSLTWVLVVRWNGVDMQEIATRLHIIGAEPPLHDIQVYMDDLFASLHEIALAMALSRLRPWR